MKKWQILCLTGIIALISALGGYQLQRYLNTEEAVLPPQSAHTVLSPEDLIGTRIEPFSLVDRHGQERHYAEWQGNIIILNFWATWCPPCIEEIPYFVALQQKYQDAEVTFIGITLQQEAEIRDFLAEVNINYPILIGSHDVIALAEKLGNSIGALPYTVIIDGEDNIAFTRRGALSKAAAEKAITALLSH